MNGRKIYDDYIIGILIPLIFGIIFLKSILNSACPIDSDPWWLNIAGSIFFICYGLYVAIFTEKEIQGYIKLAQKWHSRLKIKLWPTEREKYNFNFTRSGGILMFMIGTALLIKDLVG